MRHSLDGHSYNLNGFLGTHLNRIRIGAEGFFTPRTVDTASTEDRKSGETIFIRARTSPATEAIFRIDRINRTISGNSSDETFWIAGYAFSPERNVQIIPNIVYQKDSLRPDPSVTGRLTLYVKFK